MDKQIYGKVLENTRIVVDSLEENVEKGIYFLTDGDLDDSVPPHVDFVFTSPYNAKLLQKSFPTDAEKFISLSINTKLRIQDSVKELDFCVTLMDAKQKPGVVMYLFEGKSFGYILYAGKCCYTDDFFSGPLRSFLKTKVLDYLYIHDACDICEPYSGSVALAVKEVGCMFRCAPTSNICIFEPSLREDILVSLTDELMVEVSVTENIMKHLEEFGQSSGVTLERNGRKVLITDKPIKKWMIDKDAPFQKVVLIPCSSTSTCLSINRPKLKEKGYDVVTYRNHCTRKELQLLVKDLNAKRTVLITPPSQVSHFWSHLGNVETIFKFLDHFNKHSVMK